MAQETAKLGFYRFMHRFSRPRTYVGKFLLVAFLGVHVPLIALVFFLVATGSDWDAAWSVVVILLLATLAATAATLWFQLRLLEPVLQTASALEDYRTNRQRPSLPTSYGDEAGTLMSRAQACVEDLDQLVEFRTSLLRVMAHDLRGMVTSASLSSQLLRMELDEGVTDPDSLREYLTVVQTSTDRQVALISDIMGMAEHEEGRLELERERTDVAGLLEEVMELLRPRALQKSVTVEVDADEGTTADVDGPKVRQIVQNLADNALKFTRKGGTIVLQAKEEPGHLVLAVDDNGVGMPPEVRDNLFQAFTAGQRSGTDHEVGTGLGLWICQVLVDAHGGEISVESEEGEGTRVEVRLPV